jgi:glycosyltransferase involved in cell wall biosynthesis
MKISVALCTFNGERYLFEQLASIEAQTVLPDELVIFDDCSADSTIDILNNFKKNSRIKTFINVNPTRKGVVGNFQNAIELCSGDVIFLSDQDDIWALNKVEVFLKIFASTPSCGYVFSDANLIDPSRNYLSKGLWESVGFDDRKVDLYSASNQLDVLLKGGHFVYGMTLAFRGEFKKYINPINSTSKELTHDTWIALFLSAIGSNGVAINERLVDYRQHQSQVVGAGKERNLFQRIEYLLGPNKQVGNDYISALQELLGRLEAVRYTFPVSYSILSLREKIKHLERRMSITSSSMPKRAVLIAEEIWSGRYKRYSNNFRTALKDLLRLYK